ncbi:O-antigen ligase family protein [Pseudobacteriovorax antillogorgiicola]|uniref:O-Antigen ligase n=1 Tax=Pseudobacteriovorax antillogorgiicola TaxID=1513793 RepID=A0A1Y6CPI3_9BACT|nr:O-antigen ligase family protein [Pseudobacteriovorax antillogorgiicola]TCS42846.1 O-antigen ligase-like membrane protein [Pseudobacteriovorax antillogorgiicola]SMF81838.1 O-Antigen ligase [Pseudobacteriovorax antillogorgiicola]
MQPSGTLSLAGLALSVILSGVVFLSQAPAWVALIPLGLFGIIELVQKLMTIHPRYFLYIMLALSYFVDDVNFQPWGPENTISEILGAFFYQSYQVTPLEVLSLCLAVWIGISAPKITRHIWWREGLGVGLFMVGLYQVGTFLSLGVGLSKGGDIGQHLIQTRLHHLLPIWFFIGFTLISSETHLKVVFRILVLATTFKSVQGVVNFAAHWGTYTDPENEYLIDHFFSIYAAVAIVYLFYQVLESSDPRHRLWSGIGLVPVVIAFVLNDRRTAVAGLGVAGLVFLGSRSKQWYRRYRRALSTGTLVLVAMTAATWNVPPPVGILGSTVKSLVVGESQQTDRPDYRVLENANLLHGVAQEPIMGMGTGRQVANVFGMPDLSEIFPTFLLTPHNLFLANWAYGGPLVVAVLTSLIVFMTALSLRLLRFPRHPDHFLLGLLSFVFFMQLLAYVIGDLGTYVQRNLVTAGLLFGALFRLTRRVDCD